MHTFLSKYYLMFSLGSNNIIHNNMQSFNPKSCFPVGCKSSKGIKYNMTNLISVFKLGNFLLVIRVQQVLSCQNFKQLIMNPFLGIDNRKRILFIYILSCFHQRSNRICMKEKSYLYTGSNM